VLLASNVKTVCEKWQSGHNLDQMERRPGLKSLIEHVGNGSVLLPRCNPQSVMLLRSDGTQTGCWHRWHVEFSG
jgi:hypothetical protein